MTQDLENEKGPKNVSSMDHFEYFQKLLSSNIFLDIALKIGDKEHKTHKNILASRSPVFFSIFVEYNDGQVLLNYMHTGSCLGFNNQSFNCFK